MLTLIRDLLAHAEWANAVFFNAWGKSPARDHEEMRERVHHFVMVQESFLAILRGVTPTWPPEGPPPTFEALAARAQTSHAGLREAVASLDDAKASEQAHVPWIPNSSDAFTVSDALVQVALHSQHHRGQCMTRLKDFDGEPKNVDWIIWVWKKRPAGRWN
jgi:uncharacterized damage-inducible protein DinB